MRSEAERRLTTLFPTLGPWSSACLRPGPVEALPTAPLEPELPTVQSQRLIPILSQLLKQRAHAVDPALNAAVQAEALMSVARTHVVTRHAVDFAGELTRSGVDSVVIKGPGIAQSYAHSSLRPYGDVDVLVRPDQFHDAFERLVSSGWTENPASRQPWAMFHRWCRESVNLADGDTRQVDLHHRPSPWLWSTGLDAGDLLERSVDVAVGQARLRCADPSDNLLISALQLITDHRRPGAKLLAWRDVAELGTNDPAAAARRANDVGLGGVLKALLAGMPSAIRPRELHELLDSAIAHPRRLVAMLDSAVHGNQVRAHLVRLPVPNSLVYLVGTLAPSPSFLRTKYPAQRWAITRWWRDTFSDAVASEPVALPVTAGHNT